MLNILHRLCHIQNTWQKGCPLHLILHYNKEIINYISREKCPLFFFFFFFSRGRPLIISSHSCMCDACIRYPWLNTWPCLLVYQGKRNWMAKNAWLGRKLLLTMVTIMKIATDHAKNKNAQEIIIIERPSSSLICLWAVFLLFRKYLLYWPVFFFFLHPSPLPA